MNEEWSPPARLADTPAKRAGRAGIENEELSLGHGARGKSIMSLKTAEFDYDLPARLIAQKPFAPRDRCRLLVLHRESGTVEHRKFFEIKKYLRAGDVLVLNDSRVFKARLLGRLQTTDYRRQTELSRVEIFLLRPWQVPRFSDTFSPSVDKLIGE